MKRVRREGLKERKSTEPRKSEEMGFSDMGGADGENKRASKKKKTMKMFLQRQDIENDSSSSFPKNLQDTGIRSEEEKRKRRKKRKRQVSEESEITKVNGERSCDEADTRRSADMCTPDASQPTLKSLNGARRNAKRHKCDSEAQGSISNETFSSTSIPVMQEKKKRKKKKHKKRERDETSFSEPSLVSREGQEDRSFEGTCNEGTTQQGHRKAVVCVYTAVADDKRRRHPSVLGAGLGEKGGHKRRRLAVGRDGSGIESDRSLSSHTEPKKRFTAQQTLQLEKRTLLLQKLQGSRFRSLNECLYTSTGQDAFKAFQKDPSLFDAYHKGYRLQVAQWPVKPLDLIKDWLRQLPQQWKIADLGCGDAELSACFPERNVLSFDLVSVNPNVTACNLAQVPLPECSVHAAIFCLSLMGKDWPTFLQEAHRILMPRGKLKIAEVLSRVSDCSSLVRGIEGLGFTLTQPESSGIPERDREGGFCLLKSETVSFVFPVMMIKERIASFFLILEFEKTSSKKKEAGSFSDRRADKKSKNKETVNGERNGFKISQTKSPRNQSKGPSGTSGGDKKRAIRGSPFADLCSSLLKPCIYKRR
ncbi:methyltransferase domain-containing protein [Cystoisospora suis]|uniref:Ribosomal RNA-processing protein 8 n=1 Tax=Cystoisospora suis TaxID=483139 RepID=A0A2C6JHW3_9APIC|nr:methyltransferase domain-containing protein [Cystoisospora suis]